MIVFDHALDPFRHALYVQTERSDAVVLSNGDNITHGFCDQFRRAGLQLLNDGVNLLAAKFPGILLLGNQLIEIVPIGLLFKPFQCRIFQGCFAMVLNSVCHQGAHDAVLNGKNQILVRANRTGTDAMDRDEPSSILVRDNLLAEILAQTVVFEIIFDLLISCLKHRLDCQGRMAFAGTICALNPQRTRLFAG